MSLDFGGYSNYLLQLVLVSSANSISFTKSLERKTMTMYRATQRGFNR